MYIRRSWNPPSRARFSVGFAAFLCLCGLSVATTIARAQSATQATSAVAPASAPQANSVWSSLSKAQQIALAPLENSWRSLSAGQQRKWLVLAKTYPTLGAPEQEKMHSRMVEWAALSPKDRELARLNFAQSKAVNTTDRAANWEAYQALHPEERQKLADGAKLKPTGAAVSVKPVGADKLAAVPVTRHTPEQERAAVALQRPLNRATLLPQLSAAPFDAATTNSKP